MKLTVAASIYIALKHAVQVTLYEIINDRLSA